MDARDVVPPGYSVASESPTQSHPDTRVILRRFPANVFGGEVAGKGSSQGGLLYVLLCALCVAYVGHFGRGRSARAEAVTVVCGTPRAACRTRGQAQSVV